MRTLIVAGIAALALGLSGCNASNCGPGNCSGCCDDTGACQVPSAQHCGANGNACNACTSTQQCIVGQCSFSGGNTNANSSGNNSTGNNNSSSSSGSATATNGNTSNGTTTGQGTATATNGNTTSGTSSATAGNTTGNNTTTGNTTTSNTTTGNTTTGNTTSTTTGSTTASTTSGTTTGSCVSTGVASARTESPNTPVCLTNSVVVLQTDPGGPDGGGTVFDGKYYVADSSGNALLVFKAKAQPPTGDPLRGNAMTADGVIKPFPFFSDGGFPTESQLELSGAVSITDLGPSTLPTPKSANFADLDVNNPNTFLIGSYVQVPVGSYTENFADPGLQHVSGANVYQDGFSLSDGQGHTIWVDTFDFIKGNTPDRSCMPSDGGQPNLSSGGFRAIFDYATSPSGPQAPMLFFGDCRDLVTAGP